MNDRERDIITDRDERLEAFERMLAFVQKNYEDATDKMEELKAKGKNKTATYSQMMGNKMMYTNMLDIYRLFDLI